MVHKTVPEIDHEIAHKIDPEIPFKIVYLIIPEKVPNMLEYSIATGTPPARCARPSQVRSLEWRRATAADIEFYFSKSR